MNDLGTLSDVAGLSCWESGHPMTVPAARQKPVSGLLPEGPSLSSSPVGDVSKFPLDLMHLWFWSSGKSGSSHVGVCVSMPPGVAVFLWNALFLT